MFLYLSISLSCLLDDHTCTLSYGAFKEPAWLAMRLTHRASLLDTHSWLPDGGAVAMFCSIATAQRALTQIGGRSKGSAGACTIIKPQLLKNCSAAIQEQAKAGKTRNTPYAFTPHGISLAAVPIFYLYI